METGKEIRERKVSAYKKIDELTHICQSIFSRKLFFINEVPKNISIAASTEIVSKWMSEMTQSICVHPGNNYCIRISADASGDKVNLLINTTPIAGLRFTRVKK